MSGFRSSRVVLREAVGSYIAGVWVPGARSVTSCQASIQPVKDNRDMEALPEGRRYSDAVRVYTDALLTVTADAENVQPDLIVFNGYCYEVVAKDANQNNVINHNRYIAVRLMPFTTDADWLSGDLTRP